LLGSEFISGRVRDRVIGIGLGLGIRIVDLNQIADVNLTPCFRIS